jgi:uncharacterized protein DUF6056
MILLISSAAALAALSVRGIYVRYKADDFWTASVVARLGFWKSQSWWYERWSGRFSYTFLIGIAEAIGPRILPVLVFATIAGWLAATLALCKRVGVEYPLAVAAAFVFAASEGAPDVPQSILWQTGLLTYVVPIAGLTAWLASTVNRDRVRWYDAVVPFLLAGFSESNTIAQVIAIAGLVFVFRTRAFTVAFIASIAGLIAVGIAPGNGVRMSVYPRHTLQWIVSGTLSNTATFFLREATESGVPLLLVFVTALLFAPRVPKRLAITAVAVAICSTLVTHFATLATIGFPAPQRTLFVPHFLVCIAAACVAQTLVAVPQRFAVPVLILLAIGGPIVTAIQRVRDIPEAVQFARAWDKLDADLRRNPGREVVVDGAPGNAGTLMFITHDRDKWANRCISDYYSLTGIAAAPPGPSAVGKLLEDFPVYAIEGPRRHDDNHIVRLRFAGD